MQKTEMITVYIPIMSLNFLKGLLQVCYSTNHWAPGSDEKRRNRRRINPQLMTDRAYTYPPYFLHTTGCLNRICNICRPPHLFWIQFFKDVCFFLNIFNISNNTRIRVHTYITLSGIGGVANIDDYIIIKGG